MRWLFGLLILLVILIATGAFFYIKREPLKYYSQWIQGKGWDKYYEIANYNPIFLKPSSLDDIPQYTEDYIQLWKVFPIRNSQVPLPTRHPLFQTVPLVEFKTEKQPPQVGMVILSASGRELSRIYTMPTSLIQDYTHGQELFKLPYVRNRILEHSQDEVWKKVFTHEIKVSNKTVEEMIFDLYIMHLRSKILLPQTLRYGLIKNDQAFIELDSQDKDYMVELIMTQINGNIYSYVLRTEKSHPESMKLRSKFLNSVVFTPTDSSMSRVLYTEFKQLNFARQVDQEGMLYLFSAWTQDIDNHDLLKDMIFYLERGRDNRRQLNVLYKFSLKKYGKTFTTRNIFNDSDDPELVLQRKIEIEKIEKQARAEALKVKSDEVELTPDEKMNMYLKKVKQEGPTESDDMTVH